MDMDEVECVLANLIYRKYIKGYMSHQHKVVVISKAVRRSSWPLILLPFQNLFSFPTTAGSPPLPHLSIQPSPLVLAVADFPRPPLAPSGCLPPPQDYHPRGYQLKPARLLSSSLAT